MRHWVGFLLALVSVEPVAAADLLQPVVIAGSFQLDRQPDGNSIIFEDDAGLVVVDTGRHLEHQQKIVEFARRRGKPIRAIVNTHWHLDHSGGNAEIRAAFPSAALYASSAVERALDGFLARSLAAGEARLEDPKLSEAQRAETRLGVDAIRDRRNLIPDHPVAGTARLQLGSRDLELHLASHAATEGDVWIYDPDTATLVAGDLVVIPAPFFDTACPTGWSAALRQLASMPFKTLLPGHGDALTRHQFDIYRSAYDSLVACSMSERPAQACIDGWLHDAAIFLPTESDREAARQLLEYYFVQVLRSPKKIADFCGSSG